ncbi:MAG: PilN domain-containing protein [Acidobacteriota bacterium]
MIKVNLLRDPTIRSHRTFVKPKVSKTGPVLVAFIVLVAGGMGAWYYYINTQKNRLTERKHELIIQETRLNDLKKELAEYEEIKLQKQKRIDVIEELKDRQTGPVLLLNHVLASIPQDRLLWLTTLNQKDDRVQIVGYSQKIEAIPDFMTNLSKDGFFQSVDLETIESNDESSKFSLLCTSAQYQTEE